MRKEFKRSSKNAKELVFEMKAGGNCTEPDGEIYIYVGTHQPDYRSQRLCGAECLKIKIQ